jgi:hypothetical protein
MGGTGIAAKKRQERGVAMPTAQLPVFSSQYTRRFIHISEVLHAKQPPSLALSSITIIYECCPLISTSARLTFDP